MAYNQEIMEKKSIPKPEMKLVALVFIAQFLSMGYAMAYDPDKLNEAADLFNNEKSVVDDLLISTIKVVDVTVSGTVTDANGEPIPGATVSVAGTSIGTATDLDGAYSLSIPEGSTLTFSFIGYVTQAVPVGDRSVIKVVLEEDMASLDEVVVIGYGTAKKSDLTGSVGRITMEDKASQANVNLFQALIGASAGVKLEGRG